MEKTNTRNQQRTTVNRASIELGAPCTAPEQRSLIASTFASGCMDNMLEAAIVAIATELSPMAPSTERKCVSAARDVIRSRLLDTRKHAFVLALWTGKTNADCPSIFMRYVTRRQHTNNLDLHCP